MIQGMQIQIFYFVISKLTKFASRLIDLARITLLPRFSIDRFDDWEEAVEFYTQHFRGGNLNLIKFVDSGTPDKPIEVQSNTPTPVPPKKKKTQKHDDTVDKPDNTTAKRTPRPCWAKAKKSAPVDEDPFNSDDLYATDPAASPKLVIVPPPPHQIVVVGDSDDSDDLPIQSYPKAANSSSDPVTPIAIRKRPFPMTLPPVPEIVASVDGSPSPTYVERGPLTSKGTRPTKKARAISEPPEAQKKAMYLSESWSARPLEPLLFVGVASAFPSTSGPPLTQVPPSTPAPISDEEEGLDDNDPELPARIIPSSQYIRQQFDKKGKGKAPAKF